jgi:hypothetical protein
MVNYDLQVYHNGVNALPEIGDIVTLDLNGENPFYGQNFMSNGLGLSTSIDGTMIGFTCR